MDNQITKPRLYNTAMEVGLRSLVILNKSKKSLDVERLMYYDFIALNTKDFQGPPSLHAPISNRGIQIYSRRELIKKGLTFLLSKQLIEFRNDSSGFTYSISDAGTYFLKYFASKYFTDLTERVSWTMSTFGDMSTQEISRTLNTSLLTWGGEFASDDNLTN
ncbi:ABC-three component system middle component 2 [Parachryseolinea silvisoli]|uniref:ABC-three component system middle component 2 n=1 Tax=Parachryseolinea silvisoli TaxID=2873601 RepID=UPI0037C6C72B